MERGSWRELSKDSGIYKKLAIGAVCFLTLLPIPVALGALTADLEKEKDRIKEGNSGGDFTDFDDPAKLLGNGLAPSFVLLIALMAFCVPTIVVLMSAGSAYAFFKSENPMGVMSFLITSFFGLVALVLQFFTAIIFPIALAQYSRGMNIGPAIHPMANLGYTFDMGFPYWLKAAGWWCFVFGIMVVTITGPAWYIFIPLQLVLAGLGFTSLVISSRYALHQLQTQL